MLIGCYAGSVVSNRVSPALFIVHGNGDGTCSRSGELIEVALELIHNFGNLVVAGFFDNCGVIIRGTCGKVAKGKSIGLFFGGSVNNNTGSCTRHCYLCGVATVGVGNGHTHTCAITEAGVTCYGKNVAYTELRKGEVEVVFGFCTYSDGGRVAYAKSDLRRVFHSANCGFVIIVIGFVIGGFAALFGSNVCFAECSNFGNKGECVVVPRGKTNFDLSSNNVAFSRKLNIRSSIAVERCDFSRSEFFNDSFVAFFVDCYEGNGIGVRYAATKAGSNVSFDFVNRVVTVEVYVNPSIACACGIFDTIVQAYPGCFVVSSCNSSDAVG